MLEETSQIEDKSVEVKEVVIFDINQTVEKEVNSPLNYGLVSVILTTLVTILYFATTNIALSLCIGALAVALLKFLFDRIYFIKSVKVITEKAKEEHDKKSQEIIDLTKKQNSEAIAYFNEKNNEIATKVADSLKRYDELKYKKYAINLLCAFCGQSNEILVDFETQNFPCKTCKNENALFIQLATARKAQLQDDEDVFNTKEVDKS